MCLLTILSCLKLKSVANYLKFAFKKVKILSSYFVLTRCKDAFYYFKFVLLDGFLTGNNSAAKRKLDLDLICLGIDYIFYKILYLKTKNDKTNSRLSFDGYKNDAFFTKTSTIKKTRCSKDVNV